MGDYQIDVHVYRDGDPLDVAFFDAATIEDAADSAKSYLNNLVANEPKVSDV